METILFIKMIKFGSKVKMHYSISNLDFLLLSNSEKLYDGFFDEIKLRFGNLDVSNSNTSMPLATHN